MIVFDYLQCFVFSLKYIKELFVTDKKNNCEKMKRRVQKKKLLFINIIDMKIYIRLTLSFFKF